MSDMVPAGSCFAAGFVVGLSMVIVTGPGLIAGFVVGSSAATAARPGFVPGFAVWLYDVVVVGSGVAMGALAGTAVEPIPAVEWVAASAAVLTRCIGVGLAASSTVVGGPSIVAS